MVPVWVQNRVRVALILAHLAGLVVAVILLVRHKGTAPILATAAFGLLVLLDAAQIVQTALLPAIARQIRAPRVLPWIGRAMTCCCSLLDLITWGCLIAAIWMGMGRQEGGSSPGLQDVSAWQKILRLGGGLRILSIALNFL